MKTFLRRSESKSEVLFDQGRFKVTYADIQTPSVYYPVDATTGRVRRDILWCALGYSAAVGSLIYAYADLWGLAEILVMFGSIALAISIGLSFSILQIDARGFPSRMFVARTKTIRALFSAIAEARARNRQPRQSEILHHYEEDDHV